MPMAGAPRTASVWIASTTSSTRVQPPVDELVGQPALVDDDRRSAVPGDRRDRDGVRSFRDAGSGTEASRCCGREASRGARASSMVEERGPWERQPVAGPCPDRPRVPHWPRDRQRHIGHMRTLFMGLAMVQVHARCCRVRRLSISAAVREGASRRRLARRRVPRASVRASSGTPRPTGSRRWARRSPARTPAGPGPTIARGHLPRARVRDSRSRRRP